MRTVQVHRECMNEWCLYNHKCCFERLFPYSLHLWQWHAMQFILHSQQCWKFSNRIWFCICSVGYTVYHSVLHNTQWFATEHTFYKWPLITSACQIYRMRERNVIFLPISKNKIHLNFDIESLSHTSSTCYGRFSYLMKYSTMKLCRRAHFEV